MHEPYKGFRADSCQLLHDDMLSETHKVQRENQEAADGDTELKRACRDGNAGAVVQLLEVATDEERDAAFVVACARGHESVLQAAPELARGSSARAWDKAWSRSMDNEAKLEVRDGIVSALLEGKAGVPGGVNTKIGTSTTLGLAAAGGHEFAVCQLLEAGALVDQRNSDGGTPLHLAASRGHSAVLRVLLDHGASVDILDRSGKSALFIAAEKGHDGLLKQLIDKRAAIDQHAKQGSSIVTPLYAAAQNRHDACVRVLLDHKANPNWVVPSAGGAPGREKFPATLLQIAVQNAHTDVVDRLLEGDADANGKVAGGETLLFFAAAKGDETVVDLLLKKGAAPDDGRPVKRPLPREQSSFGGFGAPAGGAFGTPAHEEFLSEKQMEHLRAGGETPLFVAALCGHEGVVGRLLDHGAGYGKVGSSGFSPLLIAAAQGHAGVVKQLLEKGASVAEALEVEVDEGGGGVGSEGKVRAPCTPLFMAALHGHADAAEVLIEAGAVTDPPPSERPPAGSNTVSVQRTPLWAAAQGNHAKAVLALLRRGAEVDNEGGAHALVSMCKGGHTRIVEQLLLAGAGTEAADSRGLCAAAAGGHADVVAALLHGGADATGESGALCEAASAGNSAIVRVLVDRGAAEKMRKEALAAVKTKLAETRQTRAQQQYKECEKILQRAARSDAGSTT
jgi:ankyrin repeat protein